MDKNQPFFDPYNFSANMQQMPPMQNMGMNQPPMDMDLMQGANNPLMYYDQQYMYYRYLTQLLEYKTKLREWEKLNREDQQNKK